MSDWPDHEDALFTAVLESQGYAPSGNSDVDDTRIQGGTDTTVEGLISELSGHERE